MQLENICSMFLMCQTKRILKRKGIMELEHKNSQFNVGSSDVKKQFKMLNECQQSLMQKKRYGKGEHKSLLGGFIFRMPLGWVLNDK